jgi:hypothetical protein
MSRAQRLRFDEIGYWSEIKLDIVKDYASAYSRILTAQRNPTLHHVYIDAFAGAGVHISKSTGGYILGSPANVTTSLTLTDGNWRRFGSSPAGAMMSTSTRATAIVCCWRTSSRKCGGNSTAVGYVCSIHTACT